MIVDRTRRRAAQAVHIFTATGAAIGFLAIVYIIEKDSHLVWLLLGAALLIDGTDGTLARWVGVRRLTPNFNGALLDLIVDYLNYVIVPVLFLYQFELLPGGFLEVGCVFILMTSLFSFCRDDLVTEDKCFRGFPALWNVAVFHIYVFSLGPYVSLTLVAALGVLTFVPIKTIHPIRVVCWRPATLFVLVAWSVASFVIVVSLPERPFWALACVLGGTSYFIALSMYLSFASRMRR